MSLRVLNAGPLSLYQDAGRPDYAQLGVSNSGVFDRQSQRVANLLVGNQPNAVVVEALGGGLAIIATADHVVAIAGAAGPVTINGEPVTTGRALSLHHEYILRLGTPTLGLRWTLGIAGGFDVPFVLGSASTDTLGQIGPPAVAVDDELRALAPAGRISTETFPAYLPAGELTVRLTLGPRDDWYSAEAIATLLSAPWLVEADSDRIGIRLAGPNLARRVMGELASEPVVRGSVQVTSSGRPVILGPDHPVTGGYPVIGVVADADTDLLAHVRPGDTIRFSRARS